MIRRDMKGGRASHDTQAGHVGLVVDGGLYRRFSEGAAGLGVTAVRFDDEEACIRLPDQPEAQTRYRRLLQGVHSLAERGATLIVTDCSRYNLLGMLHLRNPFAPTIEWCRHQSPWVWARLLSECGFRSPDVRWSSFNSLREAGRWLLGNRVAAYFLRSHFRLTMISD